ncbi:MAG: DHH family phosphoesterase [Deltaproteobacteria bacterium]|jgi:nanoRNase/pAp phosphatase (c-di-AMP/oligoRNAs hydrolase)|nr:DHH family phosphoesterase [Deltaproteobacteria bacterium]
MSNSQAFSCNLSHSAEFSAEIIEWLRGKAPILIVTHDHPDPDALAAAYALKHLILMKTGQDSTIAFGGVIGRRENLAMVKELEIRAMPIEKVDLDSFKAVCMVDTQPGTGNNSYPTSRKVDLVIDHHHPKELTHACRWVDVRPEYGASATILFEYLQSQDVNLATKLATILFYAIKSETEDLGRDWNKSDRDAYLKLMPLCNNRILHDITRPKSSRAYFRYFEISLRNAHIYDNVLFFNLFDIDHPEIVAEIADFLMRVEGVEIVMGLGCYLEEGVLSLRSSHPDIHAGILMQKIVAGIGTGGGHSMTAGGQIRSLSLKRDQQHQLGNELVDRLLSTLKLPKVPGEPLIA